MALFFSNAFPPRVQPVTERHHSLSVNGFANLILFCRFHLHHQHSQGSRHVRCLVLLQQCRAMVHRIRGPSSFSKPVKIILLLLLFELSSYPRHTPPLLLVRDDGSYGIPTLLKNNIFSRFSFHNKGDLSPFPFSATTQIIEDHSIPRRNLTGKLFLVCKQCWLQLRPVWSLCEPCRGCAMMESIGWES